MTNPVNLAVVQGAHLGPGPKIDAIIRAYARLTGVPATDIASRSQTAAITGYRHELMYLIRRIDPTASYTLIGRFLGGRDFATVHEGIAKVEQRIQREPLYRDQVAALIRQVITLTAEEAPPGPPAKPWQLLAALSVLRDGQMTDAEARKTALGFLVQMEAQHG